MLNASMVSWNLKTGQSQGSSNTDGSINTTYTSVNTTAKFSISKWNGAGSAGTIGHGLGAVPGLILMKRPKTAAGQKFIISLKVLVNRDLIQTHEINQTQI